MAPNCFPEKFFILFSQFFARIPILTFKQVILLKDSLQVINVNLALGAGNKCNYYLVIIFTRLTFVDFEDSVDGKIH